MAIEAELKPANLEEKTFQITQGEMELTATVSKVNDLVKQDEQELRSFILDNAPLEKVLDLLITSKGNIDPETALELLTDFVDNDLLPKMGNLIDKSESYGAVTGRAIKDLSKNTKEI